MQTKLNIRSAKKNVGSVRRLCGGLQGRGKRFGIVVSRFNEALTSRLEEGCVDTLLRCGARPDDIVIIEVPGAFEIPLAAGELIFRQKRLGAVITLGVVIRGQTRHFDQVVSETAKGIRELSERSGIPVILGIIAADSVSQAFERTGIKHMNKGREWALAAVEMANLMPQLKTDFGR
jgi:6,7-dimethyl-8-ribityllumazine synthase